MPELPDVEIFRRTASRALNRKIKDIEIKKKKILKTSAKKIKNLAGKKFTKTSRHGKYLFMKTGKKVLVVHFGMTGDISYYKKQEPEHVAVNFNLNSHNLAFTSVRKFGKIDLSDSKKQYIKKHSLGPDALSVSKKRFLKIMSSCRGAVKSALMNQKNIAGMGNIYTDEVLFQLGINPKTKVQEMNKKQYEKIYKEMKKILRQAIKSSARRKKLSKNYLIRKRERLAKHKKTKCPKCSGIIKKTTIGGRTTYYCSKHQK